MDYEEARDAKEDMDRREFQGRVIDVVFAQQKRKPSLTKHQRFLFVFFACTFALCAELEFRNRKGENKFVSDVVYERYVHEYPLWHQSGRPKRRQKDSD